MTPQLVDLNADGFSDLIMGTYEGVAWMVPGNADGFGKPRHILDAQDRPVVISTYFDYEKRDFVVVDRSPKGESYPEGHGTSAAAVDWDGDGDLDLLLGAYDGSLYLRQNTGSATDPKFALTNQRIKSGDEFLSVPGGLTFPKVADWDGDGLFDLVCGGNGGGVYFFRNVGQPNKPSLAPAVTLIQPLEADSSDEDYPIFIAPNRGSEPLSPGSSWYIDVVDYEGDGDLDLIVGGESVWYSEPPVGLTKTELEELAALKAKIEPLENEMGQLEEGHETNAEFEKLTNTKQYKTLVKKLGRLYSKLDRLESYPDQEAEYIWLYRRK